MNPSRRYELEDRDAPIAIAPMPSGAGVAGGPLAVDYGGPVHIRPRGLVAPVDLPQRVRAMRELGQLAAEAIRDNRIRDAGDLFVELGNVVPGVLMFCTCRSHPADPCPVCSIP